MKKNFVILVTNKNNFLVKNENLFGFFNKEGELLREATAREFSWAKRVMPEYSGEVINFDFSSLEDKLKFKRKEALDQLISFTGMSEEAVWKFLNYFKGHPEELKISGQMSTDWVGSVCSTGGCLYSHREWCNAWAVMADANVIKIKEIKLELSHKQNANSSWSDAEGFTAEYLYFVASEAKFFIINSGFHYVTDHGLHNEIKDDDCWEIFKAPNIMPVLEARKEEAISRIKDFLLSFNNNLKPARIHYEIMRKIEGLSDLDIVNMSESEINPDWSVEGVSTGGCAYSDQNEFSLWAINPNNTVEKINDIVMQEKAGQNANSSWADSYGYNFKYLKSIAPQAFFFIMKKKHERHAERQQSSASTSWSLLRTLTRKEIMINNINSKRKIVTFGDLPQLQALKIYEA